jgi:hypothetical protein
MRYLTIFSRDNCCKKPVFFNTLLGSLLVLIPGAATAALAQIPSINPCPRIYYEEPFNSTRRVPQGCPPNAATLQEAGQGSATPAPISEQGLTETTPTQVPLQGEVPLPIAFVTPANGTVSIELINNTNTDVTYEVIGATDQRSLAGRSQVTLQELQVPINMTFVRPDGGFVTVTPREASPGVLQVILVEAVDVDAGQGALNVQQDGSVFLN